MRPRSLAIVLAAAVAGTSSCHQASGRGAQWLELGKSGGGTIFADTVSIQAADADHAHVTVRFEPFEPTHVPGIDAAVVAMETTEGVDCAQKTALVDSVQAFDARGRVVLALGKASTGPKELGATGAALCELVARRARAVRRS